jgi:hypothetical protein
LVKSSPSTSILDIVDETTLTFELTKISQKLNDNFSSYRNIHDRLMCNAAIELADVTGAVSGSGIVDVLTNPSDLRIKIELVFFSFLNITVRVVL